MGRFRIISLAGLVFSLYVCSPFVVTLFEGKKGVKESIQWGFSTTADIFSIVKRLTVEVMCSLLQILLFLEDFDIKQCPIILHLSLFLDHNDI